MQVGKINHEQGGRCYSLRYENFAVASPGLYLRHDLTGLSNSSDILQVLRVTAIAFFGFILLDASRRAVPASEA
jgi:hypothetical protein